jgi:hypothetical protein
MWKSHKTATDFTDLHGLKQIKIWIREDR